jgi:hypothetical protein
MRCDLEHTEINNKILEVIIRCNIKSFPLNCNDMVNRLGYKLYKYSELSEEKRKSCFMVSDESLKLFDNIFYNDGKTNNRIRFSIMHELGHIELGHGEYRDEKKEAEANYFASNMLAPRMAIHYSRCNNHVHVARLFNISIEAAQIAFDDYRRWHRRAVYKMDGFDKAMYSHFYNEKHKGFVYNIKTCMFCREELLNEKSDYCEHCFNKLSYIDYAKKDKYFYAAENTWLYGGIY